MDNENGTFLTKKELLEYLLSDDFINDVKEILDRKISNAIDNNTEEYCYWDPNPYGVEARLIGSSAGWQVRDGVEDELYDEFLEEIKVDLSNCELDILDNDTIYDYIENTLGNSIPSSEIEWISEIALYQINNKLN